MHNMEKNYLTEENGAKVIQVTSEMSGCSVSNVLFNETKAIWLSEEGLPQEIIIDISSLISKPASIKALAVYCWHAYPTNPKLIEILFSSNNSTYNTLGHFDLCIKSGTQVFDVDDLSLKAVNFIKVIIKETFGGKRTYLNNVYMYEDIPHNDTIISVRESRERNMPRLVSTATLRKELLTREFADDLLDMKSKEDATSILNQKVQVSMSGKADNMLLSSDNQVLISDSDLSEKCLNAKGREAEHLTSRIMEEEDEEKEKSSFYGSVKKQQGTEIKIVSNRLHESSVALDNEEMDMQLRESTTSYNRINTTNDNKPDYHHVEPEFESNKKRLGAIKQKELFKSSDTNQLDSVQLNNPNLLSNYINTINTNSIEDIRDNTEGNEGNYHPNYLQIDIRLSSLEKDVSTIKDQLDRIALSIESIVEAQNNLNESTYGYILDECTQMIDQRIGNALTNLNSYRNKGSSVNGMKSSSDREGHHRIPSSASGRKRQAYQINRNVANLSYERSHSKGKRLGAVEANEQSAFIDQQGDDQKIAYLEQSKCKSAFNLVDLNEKLEEKFMDFSNQLGQKITDTLLKPSITQLETFMKGNLNEMKLHLRNAEKKKASKLHHQETKVMRKEEQLTALLDKLQDKLDVEEKKDYHNLPLKKDDNHYVQYAKSNPIIVNTAPTSNKATNASNQKQLYQKDL